MVKKSYKIFIFSLTMFSVCACNNYSAGNRITLDYPIETNMNFDIIRKYMDTLVLKEGYNVPPKWSAYNKLLDLPGMDAKRIYFKKNPEEMYLIQFNGILDLADVYNENIVANDWVSKRENISKEETKRIIERFKGEILFKIEELAKKDKVPDSILYFHRKW